MPVLDKGAASELARVVRAVLRNPGLLRGLAQPEKRAELADRLLPSKGDGVAGRLRQLRERDGGRPGPEAAGPAMRSAREDVPIFFVLGFPKSGTTWLMRTLNAHPEVLCRGEGRFFERGMRHEHLKGMTASKNIKFPRQPSSLYNAIAEDEYLKLWVERSVWTRDDDPEEHLTNLFRLATYYFLTQKLSKTNKKMVGDKTPLGGEGTIEEISTVCPEAKVIHIIRDGRDTAISRVHHNWNRATDQGGIKEFTPEELGKRDRYRQDPEAFLRSGESVFSRAHLKQAAKIWRSRVEAACENGPRLLGENYAEVRYEDLLARPHEEFARLFSFLGADSRDEVVSRCVAETSFERRSGGRAPGQEDSSSGVRKGVAGDWKGVFTAEDKAVFKRVAGDLLIELGYEKDLDW